ncbi:TPA: AAA family ATPase [Aeromonas veronii]|uniref:AAA family ATPase n=1 Tax=Aeromonas TaxID=642 RepID=UPI0022E6543B|nr:AAA family ATPase [Aeromonas sp. Y293-4]
MNNASNVVEIAEVVTPAVTLPSFVSVDCAQVLPELGINLPVYVCENAGEYARLVPSEPVGYFVQHVEAKRAMVWAATPSMKQSLLLQGETGTGKTEFVSFLASRLGMPLARVECHCSMTPDVLDGGFRLVAEGNGVVTRYILSDVMRIYRDGGWILLDEVDKVSDEVSSRLHALADGKPVTIPETGEVINKHPNTKVWGTSNTVGDGTSMRYVTSRSLDAAFRARWAAIQIKYLSPSDELAMLSKLYPKFGKGFLTAMVKLANECRDAALGPNRDGKVDNPMFAIYATRTQRNILDAALAFGANGELITAMNFAFRDMCTEVDREIFDGLCQRVFGVDLIKDKTTTGALIRKL